jgi:hypothetical protein
MLRNVLRHKRGKVPENWRELHNKELHHLYTSPKTIQTVEPSIRRVRHVTHVGERSEMHPGL